MIITFIGHSRLFLKDDLKEKIVESVSRIATKDEKITFYCGGYGDFDRIALTSCHYIKSKYKNVEIVYVTPYLTKPHQEKINVLIGERVYDSIIYPPIESVPPKLAIIKRNEWMIDKSEIIISFVEHSYGGAYRSFKYAKKRDKKIINLANF